MVQDGHDAVLVALITCDADGGAQEKLRNHTDPFKPDRQHTKERSYVVLPAAEAGRYKDEHDRENLEKAQIVLVLVSSALFAEEQYKIIESALKESQIREKRGECELIPLLVGHVAWESDPILGKKAPLLRGGPPNPEDHDAYYGAAAKKLGERAKPAGPSPRCSRRLDFTPDR